MTDTARPTEADWEQAVAETNRLQRELDITNAGNIALWIEANTIQDQPMSQCTAWLACRIVEAHERAMEALRPSLDEVREALKPFANEATQWDMTDCLRYSFAGTGLSYGDIKRAADLYAALAKLEKEPNQ